MLQMAFIGPGGPEFLVVMLVLLLLFGAKDAPRMFRKFNEILNSVRNTADSFKREIMYGDLNAERHDPAGKPQDDASDYDYDCADEYYDEAYPNEELEREYSDETFSNLESDLAGETHGPNMNTVPEQAEAEAPVDQEEDDVRKA